MTDGSSLIQYCCNLRQTQGTTEQGLKINNQMGRRMKWGLPIGYKHTKKRAKKKKNYFNSTKDPINIRKLLM